MGLFYVKQCFISTINSNDYLLLAYTSYTMYDRTWLVLAHKNYSSWKTMRATLSRKSFNY